MCRWVHKNLPATGISYSPTKYPIQLLPTLIDDPEILKGSQHLSSSMRHCGLRMSAPSLPEGCLGATIDSPQNSGNHWQILVDSEACFSPMTCPRGERERCHKPCLPGLRPPFLPLPWPGHGQHSCCLHCSSGRGMLPILFLKALLYMILELQRRKFLKECLNGEHSTQEAWLTDITQNESLHLRLLPGLLPPLLRVSQ